MRVNLQLRCWAQAALCLLLILLPARAQVRVEARIGFDHAVPTGAPCPVSLLLENRSDRAVKLELEVGRSDPSRFDHALVRRPVTISPRVGRLVTLLVTGAPDTLIYVDLTASEPCSFELVAPGDGSGRRRGKRGFRALFGEDRALAAVPGGILVLGGRARQVVGALPPRRTDASGDATTFRIDDRDTGFCSLEARFAPDSWLAYAGLRAILWTEPDLAEMPNPAQVRALARWVELGGRLVLLSAHRPELLEDPALAELWSAPLPPARRRPYPVPPGHEGAPWTAAGPVLEPPARSDLDLVTTHAEAHWLDFDPLRVERRLGQGTVALAAFDPLVYDVGDPPLLLAALREAGGITARYVPAEEDPTATGYGTPFDPYGTLGGNVFYHLLVNQNVLEPPLGMLIFCAILYVLLIGPFDYVILRRYGRLKWGAMTLIGYTALFVAASIGATFFLFAPDEQVNRVAILDFTEDAEGNETVSGFLYHGVYAPLGGRYLPAPPDFEVFGTRVPRAPPPDERYVYVPESQSLSPGDPQVFFGPGMQAVPLAPGFNAFRASATRCSGRAAGGIAVEVSAGAKTGGLKIEVSNGLPSDLVACSLGTRQGWDLLGDLPRGATRSWEISPADSFPWKWKLLQLALPTMRRDASIPAQVQSLLPAVTLSPWAPQPKYEIPYRYYQEQDARLARPPWALGRHLSENEAVFMAFTDTLPFRDGLEDHPAGFTYVFVRKIVTLPAR